MPRRDRRSKRATRLALTLRRALALDLGPSPFHDDDLDDELLAGLYLEHRDRLLAHGPRGERPWGWWRYEPGVPEALRAQWPVGRVGDPEYSVELADRRAAWLAEHGG